MMALSRCSWSDRLTRKKKRASSSRSRNGRTSIFWDMKAKRNKPLLTQTLKNLKKGYRMFNIWESYISKSEASPWSNVVCTKALLKSEWRIKQYKLKIHKSQVSHNGKKWRVKTKYIELGQMLKKNASKFMNIFKRLRESWQLRFKIMDMASLKTHRKIYFRLIKEETQKA